MEVGNQGHIAGQWLLAWLAGLPSKSAMKTIQPDLDMEMDCDKGAR